MFKRKGLMQSSRLAESNPQHFCNTIAVRRLHASLLVCITPFSFSIIISMFILDRSP